MAKLNSLQDDLNYQQAKQSLRQLVSKLDLSAAERAGLETDLVELQTLMDKLENEVIHIAAFGMVGRGKSSLLNALLGQNAFVTGPTHGVTQTSQRAVWPISWETRTMPRSTPMPHPTLAVQEQAITNGQVLQSVMVSGLGGSQLQLIDTPGLDEVDGEDRAQLANHVARQADLILFVVSGDMTRVEFDALAQLREASKPIILVFNKIDQFPDADREAVYDKICNERVKQILSPNEVVMAAALPRVPRPIFQEDGTLTARLEEGPPDVDALRLKILEILHREGRSLVALNTLLFADQLNQQLLERKLEHRSTQAQDLIWKSARTKAVVVALNPLTLLDTIGGMVIDITLILKLSQLYGLTMTRQGSAQLLQTIVLSMLSLGAGELVATLGLGSLKTLIGSTAPLTGGLSLGAYASVAVTQAALAGVSCYTIGSAAKTYLANGANWGPEGPKAAISQILENMDEGSITARIRNELKERLQDSVDQTMPGSIS